MLLQKAKLICKINYFLFKLDFGQAITSCKHKDTFANYNIYCTFCEGIYTLFVTLK